MHINVSGPLCWFSVESGNMLLEPAFSLLYPLERLTSLSATCDKNDHPWKISNVGCGIVFLVSGHFGLQISSFMSYTVEKIKSIWYVSTSKALQADNSGYPHFPRSLSVFHSDCFSENIFIYHLWPCETQLQPWRHPFFL